MWCFPLLWWVGLIGLALAAASDCETQFAAAERNCTLHPRCVWDSVPPAHCLTLPETCSNRPARLCEADGRCEWVDGCQPLDTTHPWWAACAARHPDLTADGATAFLACHENASDPSPCLWNGRTGRCEPEPARLCPLVGGEADCRHTPGCGWDPGGGRCRALSLLGHWCPLADNLGAAACVLQLTQVPYECRFADSPPTCDAQYRQGVPGEVWLALHEAFCDRLYAAPLGRVIPCQWSDNLTVQQACVEACPLAAECWPYPHTLSYGDLDLPRCGVTPARGGCTRGHPSPTHCAALEPWCRWHHNRQRCEPVTDDPLDQAWRAQHDQSLRARWALEDARERPIILGVWVAVGVGFFLALLLFVVLVGHACHPEWFAHPALTAPVQVTAHPTQKVAPPPPSGVSTEGRVTLRGRLRHLVRLQAQKRPLGAGPRDRGGPGV